MNAFFPTARLKVAAFATMTAALALGASWAMQAGVTYPCPFRFVFEIPCPTCGTTRSLAALAAFDVGQAIRCNPLVVLGGAGALLAWLMQGSRAWLSKAGWPVFVGALLLNWIYLIVWLPR